MLMKSLSRLGALIVVLAAYSSALFAWEYETFADEFDGATYHRIRVDSEPGSTPAVLTLGCQEDGQAYWTYRGDEVLEGFHSSVGGPATSLQLSIDGTPERGAMVSDWPRSEDLKAATNYAHRAVTKKLVGGTRLIVRTVAVVGQTNDAIFDISGLEGALEQLVPFCKRI
jgi:hypothetical protein